MGTGTDFVRRPDDDTSHELAIEHLASVLGVQTVPPVVWDPQHHLQGHVVVDGEELVVIAVRTTDHTPVVLREVRIGQLRRLRNRGNLRERVAGHRNGHPSARPAELRSRPGIG